MTTPRSVSSGETSAAKEENRDTTPCFQLFSASVNVDRFGFSKPFLVYGQISLEVAGKFWCYLFRRHSYKPLTMLNQSYIYSEPLPFFPVGFGMYSVNSYLKAISVDDYESYLLEDYQMDESAICLLDDDHMVLNLSNEKYDTFCTHKIKGPGGYIDLLYIILSDPVIADLGITFCPVYDVCGRLFTVKIFAYYGGDFEYSGGEHGQGYDSVKLLEADDIPLLENSEIPLTTSVLAVPAKDSLKIRAIIIDKSSKNLIMSTLYKFHAKHEGGSDVCIQGEGCSLKVNVLWVFGAATDEENYDLKNDAEELKTGDNPEVEDQSEILFDDEERADMQTETEDPPKITDADHGQSDAVIGQEKAEDNTEPLKNHPTPRFQLFAASIRINKYPAFERCFLHGYFSVSDRNNGSGFIFKRNPFEHLPIYNKGCIYPLAHPSSHCSIPIHAFPFLDISAYLYAITLDKKLLFFEVSNGSEVLNFSDKKYDTFFTEMIKGAHGYLKLVYIVIKDPVDATLEMTFIPDYDVFGHTFWVDVSAFYGSEEDDDCGWNYYRLELLQATDVALLKNKKIPLNISCLAVPAKASLKIRAVIGDLSPGGKLIMTAYHKFPVQLEGSSHVCIEGVGCTLKMNVKWDYEATIDEENDDGIQTLEDDEELETGDDLKEILYHKQQPVNIQTLADEFIYDDDEDEDEDEDDAVIKDLVDATLEMTFKPDYDVLGHPFWVDINAYYGRDDGCGRLYRVILLQAIDVALLQNKKIPLNISCLAVPAKASLNIKAVIGDLSPGGKLITAYHKFPVQLEGSSHVCIQEKSCSLEVKVNWNHGAINYPTIADMLINAYKNALAIAVATDYSFPLADKVKEYLAFAAMATPVEVTCEGGEDPEEGDMVSDAVIGQETG